MLTDTPIRGRERELALLGDMIAALNAGRGGVGTIEGTAGIGKSRLLDEVERVAVSSQVGVSRGTAAEIDRVAPLASILAALRSGQEPILSAPDLLALVVTAETRVLLAEILRERIAGRASARPQLVMIDDLQWADPATLFMLRSLTAGLAAQPVLWLFGARPAADLTEAALVIKEWVDRGGTRIMLGPVDPAAAFLIATDVHGGALDGALRSLVEGTRGDPLLIVELVLGVDSADLDPTAPTGSFAASVQHRLRALSPETRQFLQVGTVLGRAFTVSDAAALLGRSVVGCIPLTAEAIVAGILVDDGTGLQFQHDLVRQVVHDELGPAARRGAHREAAGMLMETDRPFDGGGGPLDPPRSGERPPPGSAGAPGHRGRPDTGWSALTPAELAVVRHVAEGRTNRDVAGRLSISPHTVDSHLRHAFRKLRVSSRVELARIVIERERQPPAE